jgi:hypothetical protein
MIDRVLEDFRQAIEQIVMQPDQPISTITVSSKYRN